MVKVAIYQDQLKLAAGFVSRLSLILSSLIHPLPLKKRCKWSMLLRSNHALRGNSALPGPPPRQSSREAGGLQRVVLLCTAADFPVLSHPSSEDRPGAH